MQRARSCLSATCAPWTSININRRSEWILTNAARQSYCFDFTFGKDFAMSKRKELSVLKWLVVPSLSLTLGAIIAYVNVSVFGGDGWIYTGIVAVIVAFSIAINKYVSSPSSRLAVAAFCFEILLSLALLANAAYCLS